MRRCARHMLALFAAAGAGLSVAAWADQAVDLENEIAAALQQAQSALDQESARLDELADRQKLLALPDGTPSAAQAAANIRLYEITIRELEASWIAHQKSLTGALNGLRPELEALVKRLSGSTSIYASGENSLGLDRKDRASIQRGLTALGFDAGPLDGLFGNRTRSAIRGWQADKGHQETGYLTREQADSLLSAGQEGSGNGSSRTPPVQPEAEPDPPTRSIRRPAHGREASSEEAAFGVGKLFRDCSACPEMVVIPAGTFRMGSALSEHGRRNNEGPVHSVSISPALAVGVHEVTKLEFTAFTAETGHRTGDSCLIQLDRMEERRGRGWRNPGFPETPRNPVVCVNWSDAQAYIEWLLQKTGARYRLLTEAEWEYAARAGTEMPRWWGDASQCSHANGADKTHSGAAGVDCHDGHRWTAPAGSFRASPWGLHDMLGNVWEWTQDCWKDSYRNAWPDGRAREEPDCSGRVLRGGSWNLDAAGLRAANRSWSFHEVRSIDIGFRVARDISQ